MPFRKFFDRSDKPSASAEPEAAEPEQEPSDEEFSGEAEAPPEHSDAVDWRARAAHVLPLGAPAGRKRPAPLYGAGDALGPTPLSRAVACRRVRGGGHQDVDRTKAL